MQNHSTALRLSMLPGLSLCYLRISNHVLVYIYFYRFYKEDVA